MGNYDPYKNLRDEKNAMRGKTVSWGKKGDYISGVYVRTKTGVQTENGETVIHVIRAKEGKFHPLVTNDDGTKSPSSKAVTIKDGEYYGVWGRTQMFEDDMRTVKPGQVIALEFDGLGKTVSGRKFKNVIIKTEGFIDEQFLAENQDLNALDADQEVDTAEAVQEEMGGEEVEVNKDDVPFD